LKKFYDRFSHLDTVAACDRHPDTLPQQRPCLRVASRG